MADLVVLGLLCYLFPLISRYENTLWEHVRNAFILEVRYFHKTLGMVLIQMLPLLMATFLPYILIQTLLFWILFCPGMSIQANAYFLRPIFDMLENSEPEAEEDTDSDEEDE